MYKIHHEQAAAILIDHIETCDVDELAHIFEKIFGYDVAIDENENFICKPNDNCGLILEQSDGKWRVTG